MRCAGPWRAVEHIGEIVGKLGGRIWVLRLECGHTACRKNSAPRDAVRALLQRRPPATAPHRVRCWVCGAS